MARFFHGWPLLAALIALGASARAADDALNEPAIVRNPPPPPSQAQMPGGGFSFSQQPLENVTVEAERFEGTADTLGVLRAFGHVRAVLTQAPEAGQAPVETIITADAITADLGAKFLTATGTVTVVSGTRSARGEHLEYHWAEQTGQVTDVELRQYGLAFRARRLSATPQGQLIEGVEFSTCGLDNPDYLISARRVEVTPNKRIVAHGVTVELFQRRLLTLPRLQYSIRNGRARSRHGLPVARPGYSKVSGFSVTQPLPTGENFNVEIEPTTRVGLRGQAAWEPEGRIAPYASISWRQEHGVRARDPVLVSAVPEVGLRIGRNREFNLNAGYYREKPGDVQAGRATLTWRQMLLDRGERPGLSLSVAARASAYTNGDFYRSAGVEASVGRGDREIFEEAGIRFTTPRGHTPFLWDEVQVRTEIFGAKRIAWGNYRLEGGVSYDAQRREWYEAQVAVARRFKCLEPEIRYSSRRRFIGVNLRVLGLDM